MARHAHGCNRGIDIVGVTSVSRGAGFQYVLVTAVFQHPEPCLVHWKALLFLPGHTQSCYSRASPHPLTPREDEPREEREPQATAVCRPQQMAETLRGRHRWEQVVSLTQSLLGVVSLWGAVPSVQGVVLKCPSTASWRLLDSLYSFIQNRANLLARCLKKPWGFSLGPLTYPQTRISSLVVWRTHLRVRYHV